MEDAHAIVLSLDEGQENSNTFFAVYDGHGGAFCAFCLSMLPILHQSSKVALLRSLRVIMFTKDL
jgi:serine/threonine protein phosphatase PrpC